LAHTPIFDPPPEVTADVHLHSFEPPPDRLTQLRKAAAKAADLALDIADAEERLAELKAQQHHLIHAEIPTLMVAAGVTALPWPEAATYRISRFGLRRITPVISLFPGHRSAAGLPSRLSNNMAQAI
jgi:hypothetical protein